MTVALLLVIVQEEAHQPRPRLQHQKMVGKVHVLCFDIQVCYTVPFYSAPSAPQNVVVNVIEGSPNMVDISWSPPSEPNGIIRDYIVDCTNELGQSVSKNTQANSLRLTGLTPATNYMCIVTAYTFLEGPPGMVNFLTGIKLM